MSNDEHIEDTGTEGQERDDGMSSVSAPAGQPITLDRSTALAFAAEGLMDAYDIASFAKDTATMLKISKAWLHMAAILGHAEDEESPHKHEKTNPVGFTHDLELGLESAVE